MRRRPLETTVVGRRVPFHATCDLGTKLAPEISSTKSGLPVTDDGGLNADATGTGLKTVNSAPPELATAGGGFVTDTNA